MWGLSSALRKRRGRWFSNRSRGPRGHRAECGTQDGGCLVHQGPVKRQRKYLLSTSSTSLHFLLASGTLSCLPLPFLLPPLFTSPFPPFAVSPPTPTTPEAVGAVVAESEERQRGGRRAVYRNWSSSTHQLCLQRETKHNKYLGSSPAVLFLNLAIRTPNLSGLLVLRTQLPPPPPRTSHPAALERALPLGPGTQG